MNHAAVNVALYGASGHKWAMTERGASAVDRSRSHFKVGPSALLWNGQSLEIRLDEITFPIPGRIKGTIRLHPTSLNPDAFTLESAGGHLWRPIAPTARVEVALDKPHVRWQGDGYLDSNWGAVPLETSFVRWDWSRAPVGGGAAVLYEGVRRDGEPFALAQHFDRNGRAEPFTPPPTQALASSRIWRIPRATRADQPDGASVTRTLEDTPFYARSELTTRLMGETTQAIHESLFLDRFAKPIVQAMLPFRMPRRAR